MKTEVGCGYLTVPIILKSYVQLRKSHATPVFCPVLLLPAQAVAQLVEAPRYKAEYGGFESRFWPRSASERNEYPEYRLGVRRPVRGTDNLTTFMCRLS